jgi:hypothetical protein
LRNRFLENGMKPRQVVVTGEYVGGLCQLVGLPVGWIGRHVLNREASTWALEMIGDDFTYGSMVVRADGQYSVGWEPKRGGLPARVRDRVRAEALAGILERSAMESLVLEATPPAAP